MATESAEAVAEAEARRAAEASMAAGAPGSPRAGGVAAAAQTGTGRGANLNPTDVADSSVGTAPVADPLARPLSQPLTSSPGLTLTAQLLGAAAENDSGRTGFGGRADALQLGTVVIALASPSIQADVAVDGMTQGSAPLLIRLLPGAHRLTFTSRGAPVSPSDASVNVTAGRTTTVTVGPAR
jgi:hypothetical protein